MNVLYLFSIAVGVVGGLGGVVGYFAKGRGDSIIAYQSNELSLRDGTIARQKEELAAVTAERDTLKRQNTDLIGLVQGSPELVKLTEQIKVLAQKIVGQGTTNG